MQEPRLGPQSFPSLPDSLVPWCATKTSPYGADSALPSTNQPQGHRAIFSRNRDVAVGQNQWYHSRCTTHFSLFWGLGQSLGVRAFDPWPCVLLSLSYLCPTSASSVPLVPGPYNHAWNVPLWGRSKLLLFSACKGIHHVARSVGPDFCQSNVCTHSLDEGWGGK